MNGTRTIEIQAAETANLYNVGVWVPDVRYSCVGETTHHYVILSQFQTRGEANRSIRAFAKKYLLQIEMNCGNPWRANPTDESIAAAHARAMGAD